MTKIYIKRVLKITFLIAAIVISSILLQFTVLGEISDSGIRVYGFYQEPQNTLDVVLVGASEVYTGYNAPMAYDKYGFTSYPYAVAGNRTFAWKTMLEEIQRTQKPELIVIEMNCMAYRKKPYKDLAVSHYIVDGIPDIEEKSKAIERMACEDDIAYYFPLTKYKNKIFEKKGVSVNTSLLDIKLRGYSLLKGNFGMTGVYPTEGNILDVSKNDKREELNPEFEKGLIDFLEYCKDNDIKNVMFYENPHRITDVNGFETNVPYLNRAEDIIKSYGFDVARFDKINFEEMKIDPDRDFYNDGHLNYRGQQKFTDYFAGYLVKHYDIKPAELSDKDRQRWEESAEYTKLYYEYAEELTEKNEKEPLYEKKPVMDKLKEMRNTSKAKN